MTVVYYHCRDCRRASGALVSLFVGYRMEQVETGPGVPKVYRSSPGVGRSFCGDCGTPLSYEDERLPGEVYVPVGVFDDPETFYPRRTTGPPRGSGVSTSTTIYRALRRAADPGNRQQLGPEPAREKANLGGKRAADARVDWSFSLSLRVEERLDAHYSLIRRSGHASKPRCWIAAR